MRSILALVLLLSAATAAEAQRGDYGPGPSSFVSGLKLRGNLHYNRSAVDPPDDGQAENGYGVGLELVGTRIGIGLYGYTDGRAKSFSPDTTAFHVVAEANYYVPMEAFRLAPYAGVHSHLGTVDRTYFDDPFLPKPQGGFDSLGYQVGLRFQPIPAVAVDAQWRRQSRSVQEEQDGFLERDQILVGVVLF